MLEKIKNQNIAAYLAQFRDIRAVGLLIFLIIALLVSWSGARVIQTNYLLQRQISQLEQENQVHRLENNNLRLQNQYFNTDQYLELTARQVFGLGAHGETLVIVPKDVALAHTKQLGGEDEKAAIPTAKQPTHQHNFESWVNFFLHRQEQTD